MTKRLSLFVDRRLMLTALLDAFRKLNPKTQFRNPVMFVVLVGTLLTTATSAVNTANGGFSGFEFQICLWLFFTLLFANFAEAVAEGRGKAQAESLKRMRTNTVARKLLHTGNEVRISAADLRPGDLVVCEADDIVPGDGSVVEGIASVDESAITGESAPVIRESGGDRSAVTGGTRVISDRIVVSITAGPGNSFLDRMILLVEGARRRKTPNEIALSQLLAALTLIFLLVVATLKLCADFSAEAAGQDLSSVVTLPILTSLLVCLIPTTIGGLLSAIGISGMDRMISKNVIANSGRAVEAAGDVNVLLLDKTGTITFGNRMATEFLPVPGVPTQTLAEAAQLASLSDETPEGRSIVVLAKERFNMRAESLPPHLARFVPFSATTRMSGIDILDTTEPARSLRKGAGDAVKTFIQSQGGVWPEEIDPIIERVSKSGGTPLVVSEEHFVLGVVHLKDVVKGGIKERFAQLRSMGIRTVMVTGDNPVTAASIAAEAGVDDFMAQASPETKLKRIREEQANGHLVAMTGDGSNDAPALAQADVGVAMNTGTQAAREAGNMVDLDSNPTKLIEVVETGKQLLMTRGALTTFSVANDVAKYFAIVPAMFGSLFAATAGGEGPLAALNIMRLESAQSAILSAVIFNAIIIIALIPLALKGVNYRPLGANAVLRRNLLVYGVGGLLAPFLAIKIIDLLITSLGLV